MAKRAQRGDDDDYHPSRTRQRTSEPDSRKAGRGAVACLCEHSPASLTGYIADRVFRQAMPREEERVFAERASVSVVPRLCYVVVLTLALF